MGHGRTVKAIIDLIRHRVNGKCYVGFTAKSLSARWRAHRTDAARNCRGSPAILLRRALRKYGSEAFSASVLAEFDDAQHALSVEEPRFIRELGTFVADGGYNMTRGGEGALGCTRTAETRAKLQRRFISSETRQKIRQAKLGTRASDETRRMMSLARLNPPKATRDKLSKAGTGKVPWNKGARGLFSHGPAHMKKVDEVFAREFLVTTPAGVRIRVRNLSRYCRENGPDRTRMVAVVRGDCQQHRHYKCERIGPAHENSRDFRSSWPLTGDSAL